MTIFLLSLYVFIVSTFTRWCIQIYLCLAKMQLQKSQYQCPMSLNFSFDFSVSSFPRNIFCAVASKPLLFSCVRSPYTLEYGDQFVFRSQCKTKHEINNFHLPVYCIFLMVALGSYFHGFYVQIVIEDLLLSTETWVMTQFGEK